MAKISLVKFAAAVVKNIALISAENDPQLKLTPTGFLKMLLKNPATVSIRNIQELRSGQHRVIKIKYLPRGLESDVTSVDDCTTKPSRQRKESEIKHPLYKKIGIFMSEDEFRDFEDEALASIAAGEGQTLPLMKPLYEMMLSEMVGLIGAIDSSLIAEQALHFGANHAYPGNPTTVRNITLGESASMKGGYVKLLEDALANEVAGDVAIVGNGAVIRYDLYNKQKTGTDFKGVGALPLDAYYDPRTVTGWGADHFGVFAKGSVGFVPWNKYVGPYAVDSGNSVKFTIPFPVDIDSELSTIVFDAQLRYKDCPEYDEDGELLHDTGYELIIGLHYGLFNMPNDMFQATDPLNGVNGSFHYHAIEQEGIAVTATPAEDAVFNTRVVTEEATA